MEALKMKELHYGRDHREVGVTLANLANAYGSLGDRREQKEVAERALKILEKEFGPEHPLVAVSLQSLGDALGSLGDYAQQKEMLQRALKIKKLQYGPEHPEVANILQRLGLVYHSLGDHQQEKELLLQSLRIRETLPETEKLAALLAALSTAFESLGDDVKGEGDVGEGRRNTREACWRGSAACQVPEQFGHHSGKLGGAHEAEGGAEASTKHL